ncbi:hypothetical protein ACS3UN_06090 [Oscillospiraceae bacterium LTW-04]|nr:hypothetical protein RBH76_04270 [Oscillospiraceae bacterium MB24-C1]
MVTLGALHYVYIIMTVVIIAALMFKKEIVLPCIIGVLLMGFVSSGNIVTTIQIMYNALVASSSEFLGIIVVIALVVSMSKSLGAIGADELMIRPFQKVIKSPKVAFFVVGFVMMIAAWFIWPSPAVALVGALLLPVALKAGLPAIWAAVSMNLFGHGIALSVDFFIQGAPAITAKSAGIEATDIIEASIPLWLVMSGVTLTVAFIMFLREMKKTPVEQVAEQVAGVKSTVEPTKFAQLMALITPVAFVIDVVLMIMFDIVGGDATALVGGTAVIIMSIIVIGKGNILASLDDITDMVKDGFIFAIKIFAPVIVIASFFFMGSGSMAGKVLGEGAPDILTDLGMFMANLTPLAKPPIAIIQALIGVITGLDGSGFSGLPLVGSLAHTFSLASGSDVATLSALGQIITIWTGGGTIIPWGVIPVAAICNVKAADLARKNLIAVLCGMGATLLVAMFLI